MSEIWQLQEAKSKFSALVQRAISHGAQVVTRHGKKAVVVLSYEEYEKLSKPTDKLSDFLLASPLAGSDLTIERDQSLPREFIIEP